MNEPWELTAADYERIDMEPGGINAPQNIAHAAQVKLFSGIKKNSRVVMMGKDGQIPMHVEVRYDYWQRLEKECESERV